MKLFIKNCFLALLCLYRSLPTSPFRGQGATPPTLQGLKAIAYIGSRYPCLLAKLLKLSHFMIKIKQATPHLSFPPSYITFRPNTQSHSSTPPSWFLYSRYSGQDFGFWFLVKSRLSLLGSRFSPLGSCLLALGSIRPLLISLLLLLAPKVAITQSTGVLSLDPAPVVIYGELHGMGDDDTINIIHWNHYLDADSNQPPVIKSQVLLSNGDFFHGAAGAKTFNHKIEILNQTGIISIYTEKRNLIDKLFIQPGDSILFMADFRKAAINFSGPAASKMKVQQDVNAAHESFLKNLPPVLITGNKEEFFSTDDNLEEYQTAHQSLNPLLPKMEILDYTDEDIPVLEKFFELNPDSHLGWNILNGYQSKLDPDFYELLKIDLQAKIGLSKIQIFSSTYKSSEAKIAFYEKHIKNFQLPDPENPISWKSPAYLDLIFEHCTLKAIIEKQPIFELYASFPDGLRDLLMGKYLAKFHQKISNPEIKFVQALKTIKTPWILETVDGIYNSQKIGTDLISTFFHDKDNQQVAVKDLHGKILLIDYWFTGCGACAIKYKNYLSLIEQHFLDEKGFTILSVNTDKKMETWKKSLKSNTYTSPNNTNVWTGGTDHEILKHYNIVSYPTLMLVDKEGKIALMGDFPKDVDEMIAKIEELIDL